MISDIISRTSSSTDTAPFSIVSIELTKFLATRRAVLEFGPRTDDADFNPRDECLKKRWFE